FSKGYSTLFSSVKVCGVCGIFRSTSGRGVVCGDPIDVSRQTVREDTKMSPIEYLRLHGKKLLGICTLALLVSVAEAGPFKVYGSEFAWVNNFNNSTINSSFSTNSVPGMTVWYNFSSFSLYGYPAIVRGWHYGWNPAGDTLFPKQISATKSVP